MTKFGGMPIGNGDPFQSIQMSSKFMKEHFR